jgi:hypothetical protein
MLAPGGSYPGEAGQQIRDPVRFPVGRLAKPAQITVPALAELRGGITEHGRGALVIATVVPAAGRVHPVLPARPGHRRRAPAAGSEQLAGGGHRDPCGDPRAQQRGEHVQLVQRAWRVGQPDPGVRRVGPAAPVKEPVHDPVVLSHQTPCLLRPARAVHLVKR